MSPANCFRSRDVGTLPGRKPGILGALADFSTRGQFLGNLFHRNGDFESVLATSLKPSGITSRGSKSYHTTRDGDVAGIGDTRDTRDTRELRSSVLRPYNQGCPGFRAKLWMPRYPSRRGGSGVVAGRQRAGGPPACASMPTGDFEYMYGDFRRRRMCRQTVRRVHRRNPGARILVTDAMRNARPSNCGAARGNRAGPRSRRARDQCALISWQITSVRYFPPTRFPLAAPARTAAALRIGSGNQNPRPRILRGTAPVNGLPQHPVAVGSRTYQIAGRPSTASRRTPALWPASDASEPPVGLGSRGNSQEF